MTRRAATAQRCLYILAASLLACSSPRPSPEYERARSLWTEIVAARPQAPAEDPRADEVLALLRRVPHDSADAPAAAELRERIEAERREVAADRARRERLAAGAAAPAPPLPPPARGLATVSGRGSPEADASPPPLPPGLKLEEFRSRYGTCFDDAGPATVTMPDAGPREGVVWLMKDDARCREAYPRLAGQVAVFVGGALAGVRPREELRRVETRREAEVVPLPDGGVGMRVDGGIVPLAPNARVLPVDGGPAADAGGAR
jgi:hypothetical protein